MFDSRENCNAIIETSTNTLITGCKTTIIPESVTCIGDHAFWYCRSLQSINIPKNVKSLSGSGFQDCQELKSITVDTNNPYYDSRYNCNAIINSKTHELLVGSNSTILPKDIKKIGDSAFAGRKSLPSVLVIPEGVDSLGWCVFDYCQSLENITIPSSVSCISAYAFEYCTRLTDVYCYAIEIPKTEWDVFRNSNFSEATLHVRASSLATYQSTAPWSNFKEIVPIEEEDDDLQRYLDSLTDTEDELTDNVYRREFKNGDWQALYIPFEMDYNDWSGEFEVAELWRLFEMGSNHYVMEATMKENGSLMPNHPYLIRAKSEQGATLTANVTGSITKKEGRTPLSGEGNYIIGVGQIGIWGNYSKRTGMNSNNEYRMQGGSLSVPYSDAEVLMPYRWYASARPGNSSRIAIEIIVDGSTAIKSVTSTEDKAAVYNLSGKRMEGDGKSLPKGVYIIDNKKRVIK